MQRLWGFLLTAGLVFNVFSHPAGAAASVCDSGSDNQRLRTLISEIAEDAQARMSEGEPASAVQPQLEAALRLRMGLARAWERKPLLSIDRAPYFGALLESQYSTLRDQAVADEIARLLGRSLESMFDELLDKVSSYEKMTKTEKTAYAAKGPLEKQIADVGQRLKGCILHKAIVKPEDLKLSDDKRSCKLDQDESRIKKPGGLKLIANALICPKFAAPLRWLFRVSRCDYRKMIFNTAKPDLIDLRKKIPDLVKEASVTEFPKALIEDGKGLEIQASIPGLLNQKISGSSVMTQDAQALWSSSLLDSRNEFSSQEVSSVCLREAALGQQSDLKLASALKRAGVANQAAAPLLYGAVNRLFLIAGGSEVTLDPRARIPLKSSTVPLPTNQFGGWGYGSRIENAAPSYLVWDLDPKSPEFYNSAELLPDHPKSPLRLFPAQITVGVRGEALSVASEELPREKLSDVVALGQALVNHVDQTAVQSPLGAHFASADVLKTDLLKPERPAAFPDQARSVAVGLLVAIVQNLSHLDRGHIETMDSGVLFHELIGLEGRLNGPLRLESFARLGLWDAAVQRSLSAGDSVYPKEITDPKTREKLNLLLGAVSLTIAGIGVETSGLIKEWIYSDPDIPNEPTLLSQVTGLRALAVSLSINGSEPVRSRAVLALQALDRFWVEGSDVPRTGLGSGVSELLKPEDAWQVINFWNEMKRIKLPELLKSPEGALVQIDYAKWDARMRMLRARLLGQLATVGS